MSLIEIPRGALHAFVPKSHSPWVDNFQIEEMGDEEPVAGEGDAGEEENPVPPPLNSKVLFRESAELPNRDRLQISIGRVLLSFRSNDLERLKADDVQEENENEKEDDRDEQVLAASARVLSRLISDQPRDYLIRALRKVVANLRSHSSNTKDEMILESFEGYVDQVEGDTAYVRLKSREHGDVLYGEYSAAELLEKGIEEQSRFLCKKKRK